MTPFGLKLKSLRKKKKISLAKLSRALKISTAYLSMIENGKRGRPTDGMVELICAHLASAANDVEELKNLAKVSSTNIKINTKKLGPNATLLTNVLNNNIRWLEEDQLLEMSKNINETVKNNKN